MAYNIPGYKRIYRYSAQPRATRVIGWEVSCAGRMAQGRTRREALEALQRQARLDGRCWRCGLSKYGPMRDCIEVQEHNLPRSGGSRMDSFC